VTRLVEFLVQSGPVMVPIGLAAVIGTMAFLERLWALRRERVVPRGFSVELIELLRQQRWNDALTHCRKSNSPVARVVEVAVLARGESRSSLRERVEEIGRREAMELERWIWIVATVASVGPLLGLLGTVSGMIQTFQTVQGGGMGRMEELAGGIGVALGTTLGGIAVAIPAVVGHRLLLARVDDLTLDLEEVATGAIDLLAAPSESLARLADRPAPPVAP
jgi:biopolymer transport protein ExbB